MYYDIEASGKRIKLLRTSLAISQAELAEKIGIHVKTISKAERGICGLSVDYIILLSVYFEVSLDYLILGKKNDADNEITDLLENHSAETKVKIVSIVRDILKISK